MALRIRKNNRIMCAAMTQEEEGDTYIDDDIHYRLSVLTSSIVATESHNETAEWYWKITPDMEKHFKDLYPGLPYYIGKPGCFEAEVFDVDIKK